METVSIYLTAHLHNACAKQFSRGFTNIFSLNLHNSLRSGLLLPPIKKKNYWGIVDLQVVLVSVIQQSESTIHIHISTLL